MVSQNFQVLIVDDNEINRDMLARRLQRRDFDLTMAKDGREAIALVKSRPYDLILLDIMMPEIDGYEVLKYLKNEPKLRDIPVIMISAIEEMDSVMKCMEIGADDYLTKPFDPDMLKAAISRALSGKSKQNTPMPPSMPYRKVAPIAGTDDSQISAFRLPDNTTRGTSTNVLTLDEVVLRIMQSGIINRKSYLYFSKAIFISLFENFGLTEKEVHQIRSVFDAVQSGKIKVVDTSSVK
ncbi:response regulator [Pseudanabaena biceps]|nr:response regulator [Pseudanabaena biceps]